MKQIEIDRDREWSDNAISEMVDGTWKFARRWGR